MLDRRRLLRTALWVTLGCVLLGSTTECRTVLRLRDDEAVSMPRNDHGGAVVGMRHPTHYESGRHMRLEMFGGRGDAGELSFRAPEAIEDLEQLASMTLPKTTLGRWWSFGQYADGKTSLDLVGALTNDYLLDDLVDYATTTDEGLCSVTVPWLAEDVDPNLEPWLGDLLGDGLAQIIVDGFDQGMAPRLGPQDALPNQFWFADFSSSLSPDEERPTQLVADWRVGAAGAADHRTCIRSYFFFSGAIDWSPNGAGEVFQWIAGGWIPSAFQIGKCPGNRAMALTVCGQFDVTREGDQVYDGNTLVDAPPGGLTFRVDEVRAWMNRYPRIRVACNNAKGDIERGIEDVVGSLVEPSFGAMAAELTSLFPFELEEVRQSAEGLTMVIARDEDDPDAALAQALGLCEPRMPQGGMYTNVIWEGSR